MTDKASSPLRFTQSETNQAIIEVELKALIAKAAAHGIVFTVTNKSLTPLAMGNYESVIDVRPMRHPPDAAVFFESWMNGLFSGLSKSDAIIRIKAFKSIAPTMLNTVPHEDALPTKAHFRGEIKFVGRLALNRPIGEITPFIHNGIEWVGFQQ